LIWLFGGLVFLSMIAAFPPRHTHMVSLIPVIALIGGSGLSAVLETFGEHLPPPLVSSRAAMISVSIEVISILILYAGVQNYFVKMPKTYPPSFEDFAAWVAWRTEKPHLLIYLGRTDVPHRLAYGIKTKMATHAYMNLDPNTFSPQDAMLGLPTVLFVETKTKEGFSYLQKPSVDFGASVPFYDAFGNVAGYTLTNSSDTPLAWRVDLADGWNALMKSPAGNILLVLLTIILLVGIAILWRRFTWLNSSLETGEHIHRETDKSTEGSDAFEVEFHFRIRFPSRRKLLQDEIESSS